MTAIRFVLVWAFAACAMSRAAGAELTTSANPIRKVVTMLEAIKKKVEAEGEKESELHEQYMCYCKNSGSTLEKTIAESDAKAPQVSSAITEGEAKKAQLDEDLVAHKADREAAKKAMADAAAIRAKGAETFASLKAESDANIGALNKAVAALEKGMAGAFLQTPAASVVRGLVQSQENLAESDRQDVMAFLAAGHNSGYSPQSGQVTGILKQLGDEMSKDLSDAKAAEEESIESHKGLMAAKTKEVSALTASIEEKTVRTGELAVSIVEMKGDLSDTQEALEEDKKFLADLKKNCGTKAGEWEEIVKTRAEEMVALTETIKLLQDDEALDLFKKTLPSAAASLVQVQTNSLSLRARALEEIRSAQRASRGRATSPRPELAMLALALQGKGGTKGFEKVLTMIDEMVEMLKKEQTDDDSKKSYCADEFDSTDDKKKGLELSISDSEKSIAAAEDSIATLASEIKTLMEGIASLDKTVAEATEQRKKENADYKELMAQDAAAKKLIGVAKNRLNQFYNPKLYNPPPKRELTEEERLVTNFGGTLAPTPAPGGIAGSGVTVLAQVSSHTQSRTKASLTEAPPPPPEAVGAYSKKSEETTGVITMMDMLIKDLDKEMTVAETEEKDAQADYEQAMKDSAEKREMDSKELSHKESTKAETAAALQSHTDDKASASKEHAGLLETIAALHSECDWLIKYYDARKEARASEVDSLTKAKAVLSGADFALVQSAVRRLRGHA